MRSRPTGTPAQATTCRTSSGPTVAAARRRRGCSCASSPRDESATGRARGDDGPRRPQAVDRGADDPARVAGSLAAGVEPDDARALAGLVVARDADRRAAARLGAGE